jgi:hypothetical protein
MPGSASQKKSAVMFDIRCTICKKVLGHPPIKVPVGDTLHWSAEDSTIEFKVYTVCTNANCIAAAVRPLRELLQKGGLVVTGLPGRLTPGAGGSE